MDRDNNLFRFSKKSLHGLNNEKGVTRYDLLSDMEKSDVLELSREIDRLSKERDKVLRILLPLTYEKEKLDTEIGRLKQERCEIEGHRFIKEDIITIPKRGEFHKCTLCGRLVATNMIMPKDTKKRVRIQYKGH